MPQHTPWEPGLDVGHPLIDTQHRALLAQCDLLATHCEGGGDDAARRFDTDFERLQAMAREHFEAEAALLARHGYPDLDDHRDECDEFDYLVEEIVTTEHFDRLELQRFLTLWWIGHITEAARRQRAHLAGADTDTDA